MGVHVGEAERYEDDWVGLDIHRAARLMDLAHGGQVLVSEAAYVLAKENPPDGVGFLDLGRQRLRGLGQPGRVFQVTHPTLESRFPPLRSAQDTANNLPTQLTSFVGREQQVSEVEGLLDEHRPVTLTGVGGVGKSRLALEVAARQLDGRRDGVWLVELAPVADPALVVRTVAIAIGVVEHAGASLLDGLRSALEDRSVLLVLDNCEHLVGSTADLVVDLLRNCPDLAVLATSREALGVPGEVAWSVPSLSLPSAEATTSGELAASGAVQLFLARARQVDSGFTVDERTAPAVAEICVRLDGIPLAIELAAARLKVLDVGEVSRRLDDAFRLLTGGVRTAIQRQQTLEATLDWSYDLLEDDEKLLLQRLSVFAGPFTLEACEAVCAGGSLTQSDILDLLTHLVDKSLVAVSPGNEHRYRLLETVRQYARGKLVRTADAEAVFRAHRDWHFDFVQRAEPHLRGRDQRSWLERLDREYADLRAAFEWSLAAGEIDAAEKVAVALVQFFFRRGHARDGVAWLERLIEAEEAAGQAALRARLAHGWLTSRGAATAGPDAEPRFHETVALAQEHGDARAVALARANLGTFLHGSSPDRSEEILSQVLDELRGLDGDDEEDAFIQAVVLLHLGNISRLKGRYAEARQRYEQAEVLANGIGDLVSVAWARTTQGIVDRYLGQLDRAIELHAQAAQTSDEVGDRFGSAFSRSCIGIVELVRGDLTAAQAAFEESLATVRALGATFMIVEDLMFLALTAHLAGDDDDARRRLIEAFDRNRGHQRSTTAGLVEITASLLASTEPVEAVCLFAAAATASRPPYWTAFFEPTLVQLRESLGPDGFADAWADGRGYSREEAVEIARARLIEDGHA